MVGQLFQLLFEEVRDIKILCRQHHIIRFKHCCYLKSLPHQHPLASAILCLIKENGCHPHPIFPFFGEGGRDLLPYLIPYTYSCTPCGPSMISPLFDHAVAAILTRSDYLATLQSFSQIHVFSLEIDITSASQVHRHGHLSCNEFLKFKILQRKCCLKNR